MKQGDVVLIWGASGGLGSYATQLVLNGGGIPVCVVSSPEKAELCRRMGAELVIDRTAEGFSFWKDEATPDPAEWKRFGARIRELTGRCLAPEEGLGVHDTALRERHLDAINRFRNV
jgi:crotonyl-CoA reductase